MDNIGQNLNIKTKLKDQKNYSSLFVNVMRKIQNESKLVRYHFAWKVPSLTHRWHHKYKINSFCLTAKIFWVSFKSYSGFNATIFCFIFKRIKKESCMLFDGTNRPWKEGIVLSGLYTRKFDRMAEFKRGQQIAMMQDSVIAQNRLLFQKTPKKFVFWTIK